MTHAIGSILLLIAAVAGIGYYFWGRGQATRAETAKEFVGQWVAAHDRKDVDAVLALTAKKRFNPAKEAAEKSELGRAAIALDEAKQREELVRAFKDNDMWVRAASLTRYEGEREHGDHIHLQVSIQGARTEMVLVREDGTLKAAPDPSNYD